MISAVEAMEAIGIDPEVTRSVLKTLLRAYDDNWEYIEEENYRLLADSIFESQVSKVIPFSIISLNSCFCCCRNCKFN